MVFSQRLATLHLNRKKCEGHGGLEARKKEFHFGLDSARRRVQGRCVDNILVMQGRQIGPAELEQVRALLVDHPDWSRYRLSRELCQVWNWRNHVGQIKDMAARALLLKLEEQRWVALPARRRPSPNRMRHKQIQPLRHPTDPITGSLSELQPLQIQELSQQPEAQPIFDSLLHQYQGLPHNLWAILG